MARYTPTWTPPSKGPRRRIPFSFSIHVAPAAAPPAAAAAAARLEQLELDHLLVAHLAVEVVARQLEVLVQPLEHHLAGQRPLLAGAAAVTGGDLGEPGHAAHLGLVLLERLLVREGDGVAPCEPAHDRRIGPLVVLAAAAELLADPGAAPVDPL